MVIAYSWTGCYVGVNGGGGWGDNHSTLRPSPDPVSQAFWNPAFNAGAAPSNFNYTNSGGVAGGQVGCNWQTGQFVIGGEADIDWANLKGSQTINTVNVPGFVPGFFSSSSNLQWLGTVRGRIGWSPATADHVLFYGTGGLAYGSVNYNTSFAFPTTLDFQTLTSTNTQTGWTAGAGVEWAFTNNWTFKAEYLYVDLGNRTFTTVGTGRAANVVTTLTDSFSNRYNIVRVGLNYKFGWGGPVVAKY
jgi:outer membrane immunogenic protein